jgi:hypothetical protein
MAEQKTPTLEDFKALGASLPPTSRVSSSEVPDLLGAVIAYVTHGKPIFEAPAQQGGVYAFLHDVAAKFAERNGDPVPQKGAQLTQPANQGMPVVTQTAAPIDYDQLAAAMLRAQQAHAAAEDATSAKTDADAAEPAPDVAHVDEPDENASVL